MDDAEDLVPVWLRFVKGLIDSDDLPLNVSRELLQDSRVTRTIRKQVIKRTLDSLTALAEEDAEKYETFWTTFGAVLKEGLHFEYDQKEKLSELMRYRSSQVEGWTSLAGYVERMPEGQTSIYYITGDSERAVRQSPHLEALKKKGFEVLYMTDAIDEWAVNGIGQFNDTPLVSALNADLSLDETEEEKKERADKAESYESLAKAIQTVLDETVSEVQVSARLTDSPVCLVVPEGGINARMERLLRASEREVPTQKRVLEINPDHALVQRLKSLNENEPGADQFVELVQLLHDQALLIEGSPIGDPQRFARQLTQVLERVSLL
jgi:molecular chaperone HtpG